MATLSSILKAKSQNITFTEVNIEKGEVYYFNPGVYASTEAVDYRKEVAWSAPRNGTVIVEIWGASGSGAKECCCGGGVPGNPGAYSRRTLSVNTNDTIAGTMGMSCGNTDVQFYRGRSTPTCICYVTSSTDGTMCADGGIGGCSFNGSSGNSHYCCFVANSFCNTQYGSTGCGLVCNRKVDADIALATGGDINCSGGFSCTTYYHCNSCCSCSIDHHVKTSPGVFANDGGTITYKTEADRGYSQVSGASYHPFVSALNSLSRQPGMGQPVSFCWSGGEACGCYDISGCKAYLPHGIPGPSGTPCDNVRDHGLRGGHGAVRIKFIG
tara:strand:- start:6325 stop:7302 length:978 start_codon:yes stop_codon:yes gene_type:complete